MFLFRRHLATCSHAAAGRNFTRCNCPIWLDGRPKIKVRSLKTKNWERALKDLVAFENGERHPKRISEAIKDWDDFLLTKKIRQSTMVKYRRLLGQFAAWCSQQDIAGFDELDVESVDAFRSTRKHIALTTAVKELQCLRGFFSFSQKRGWCRGNAAAQIETPKIPPNKVIPYTSEQVTSILSACRSFGRRPYERLRAEALVLVMRHTGLRISDALMLRKDQVREGVLQLFTRKTDGHVLLPIPNELSRALDRIPLPIPNRHDNGYFFYNGAATAKRVLESGERMLRSVFSAAKVPGAHAHRFRHTLATELLGRGATEQEVADVLGISPAIVRKHYAKWSQARQNRIFDLMRQYQGMTSSLATGAAARANAGKSGKVREAARRVM